MTNDGQLPRGRHALPQEAVIANQRRRLLDATASLIAERGYSGLLVSEVSRRAGVSPRTFYGLFEDKLDCVLATQSRAMDSLRGRILAAYSSQREWSSGIAMAVSAVLDFAVSNPDEARLALALSCAHLEPELARSGLSANRRLVALLDESARECPEARSPERFAGDRSIGAAISIVSLRLSAGDVDALTTLGPELTRIVLTPYLGDNEANRLALAA